MPEGPNQILVRLENLADLFDGAPTETPMFDLNKYVTDLYMNVNGVGADEFDFRITERALSNNQDYAEMAARKFAWPTESGPSPTTYPAD